MTAYRATLEELYARASRGIEPGLDRIRRALAAVGHPERGLDVVHVAGTNGKGSAAAMISTGWGGGLFTSPHLSSLTERFRIDGQPVGEAAVVAAWAEVRERVAEIPLTFFETVTLLAFVVFRRAETRRAVLEVGLGGRLDSTNVIEAPRACAITRIGLDHVALLGPDLRAIAAEKAGILKRGVACVVGPQVAEVDAVLDARAAEVGAALRRPELRRDPFEVTLGDRLWDGAAPRLPGLHQRENAAVAVAAMWELGLDDDAIARGLAAPWPGRLERVEGVLLDGAHNLDGARALAAYLEGSPPVTLVFGAMRDKPHARMLHALRPRAARVIGTCARLPRAESADALGADHVALSVEAALELARLYEEPIVVAGSLFVVAEARAALLGIEPDPPIAL